MHMRLDVAGTQPLLCWHISSQDLIEYGMNGGVREGFIMLHQLQRGIACPSGGGDSMSFRYGGKVVGFWQYGKTAVQVNRIPLYFVIVLKKHVKLLPFRMTGNFVLSCDRQLLRSLHTL